MGYYDLSKEQRIQFADKIKKAVELDLSSNACKNIQKYSADKDTYIRKNVYLVMGKLYRDDIRQRKNILTSVEVMYKNDDEKIRQTAVYACGEIGKTDFDPISKILGDALSDDHHSVRNAAIGALKQLGEKNPKSTLKFAKKYLHHPDPGIRHGIIHGIELRGRTHPEEILPLLAELQNDKDKKITKMIIHVLGQISYKKGCIEKVIAHLKTWNNQILVEKALGEIIDVHKRYSKFSHQSPEEARKIIRKEF
jgi:HEAT repeat protein